MTTFLKWFVPLLAFVAFVGYIAYGASIQNITTRTMAETEVLLETAHIGAIRTDLNERGQSEKDALYVDKKELVENLLAEIATTQKNLTYKLQVNYAFVDAGGEATTIDKDIRGIQYRIRYIDQKGKVKGTAERHLTLNELE